MFPFPSPAAGAGAHTRLLAPGAWPSGVTHLDAFYASSCPAPAQHQPPQEQICFDQILGKTQNRGSFTHTDKYEGSLNLFLCISHRQKHDLAVLCKILVQNVSQFLRVFHHTESMDASIDPILPITVVVIPASVTFYEGFEHAVLDAVGVVGLIRPPVGVLSYRVAFVPTKFSCKQKSKALKTGLAPCSAPGMWR